MWLKSLKIAIIEKDTDKFQNLLEEIPKYTDNKKIEEALYLISSAKEILDELKNETQISMIKIKKNIDFLNATRREKKSRFDVTY